MRLVYTVLDNAGNERGHGVKTFELDAEPNVVDWERHDPDGKWKFQLSILGYSQIPIELRKRPIRDNPQA
jgi:hypothetical protein